MADPADQLALFLPVNRTAFEPAEPLAVSVLWACQRAPGTLHVRLFWVTRGKGTEDLEIVAEQTVGAGSSAGEAACTFALPHAPWSFSGRLISLVWGVEVVDTTADLVARAEFVLAPGAREIRLDEAIWNTPVS